MSDVYAPRPSAPRPLRPAAPRPGTPRPGASLIDPAASRRLAQAAEKRQRQRTQVYNAFERPDNSLGGQLKNEITAAVTQGPSQIIKKFVGTTTGPVRAAVDAVKDGGLRGDGGVYGAYKEYVPLPNMVTDSLENTYRRNIDPLTPWNWEGPGGIQRNWKEASDEHGTVGAIFEDVGNAAIVGAAATKVVGRAPRATTVTNIAEKAAIEGAPPRIRSAGAAADPVTAVEIAAAQRTANRTARTVTGELVDTATVPTRTRGTGLAGAADRAGYPNLSARLDTVGQNLQRATRVLDAPDNLTVGIQLRYGAKLAGAGVRGAATRLAPLATRLTGNSDNLVNQMVDPDAQARRDSTGAIVDNVKSQKADVQHSTSAVLAAAKDAGLSQAEGVAALNAIDQRFTALAAAVRELTAEGREAEARRLVGEYGADRHPSERPTYDDIAAVIDYEANPHTPAARRIYDISRQIERDLVAERTQRMLDAGDLNPDQLGNDMLPAEVDRVRGKLEQQRDQARSERGRLDNRAVRTAAIERAHTAINATLPDPPNARALLDQGSRQGAAAQALRQLHTEHARAVAALNDAVNDYIRASERSDSAVTRDLEAIIDRLTEEATQLEQRIRTDQRRYDAARGLSDATGDIETVDADGNVVDAQAAVQGAIDEIAARPEPDLTNMPTVSAIVEVSRQVADEIKVELWGQMERLFQGMGLSRVDINGRPYDWYNKLTKNEQKVLSREGFLIDYQRLRTPDQLAQTASEARDGRPLSEDQAVQMYLDLARQLQDVRIKRTARNRRQKRGPAGLVEIDTVTGERIVEYGPTRYREGPPVNDIQIAQVAERTGLDPRVVDAALNGNAKRLREAVADSARDSYDDVRRAFDGLDPTDQATVIDGARATAEQGGDVIAYLVDTLELDQQTAMLIDGTVTGDAIVSWLAGPDIAVPETFVRAVTEHAGPAQRRIVARLQQTLRTSRAALRENYSRQRETRRLLDRSRDLDADRVDDLAGRVDVAEIQADAAAARLEDVETNRPRLDETTAVTDKIGDVWKRYRRTVDRDTGKQVPAKGADPARTEVKVTLSRAEQAVARRERAVVLNRVVTQERRRHSVRARRYDDRIADLNTELGRSFQQRLVEDVNTPAVKSMFGMTRLVGKRLGGVVEARDGRPATLTGLMETVARRLGGTDAVNTIAAHMAGRTFDSVAQLHEAFLDGARDARIDIDGDLVAPGQLRDSLLAENALEAMRHVQDAAGGTDMQLPFKVYRALRDQYHGFPQDVRNQIDARYAQYQRARTRATRNMTSDYLMVMPKRFREVARESTQVIGELLDLADQALDSGDWYLADIYNRLAEQAPTTLQMMQDQGINPNHLIGGQRVPESSSGKTVAGASTIGRTAVRSTKRSTGGGRVVGLNDYLRVEMTQQIAHIDKMGLEAIRNHPHLTSRVDRVIGEVIDDYLRENPYDTVMPPDLMTKALEDAGWSLLPGDTAASVHRGTPVVPMLARRALDAQSMGTRPLPIRALSAANRIFKYSVLAASPLWQIGNFVGNLFMMTMGLGKVSIFDVPRLARQMIADSGGVKEFWKRGGVASWAPDRLASHGLSYGEHQLIRDGWDATKKENVAKRAVNLMYSMNEFMDNSFRSMTYADQMQKMAADPTSPGRLAAQNMTASEAAVQHTLRALGDFTNMTPFEKRYVREVFPFWAWLRHQTLMTMRMPLYSPARTAYLVALTDLLEDDDMADEWYAMIGSRIPIGDGSTAINLGGISPFASPLDMPLNPFNIGTTVGAMTPMLKLPVQLATGYDPNRLGATSRPYEDRGTDMFGREEPTSPFRRAVGDPLGALGEIGYIASGTLPQTKAARNLALGPGQARYGSGDRVGYGQYDDPNRTAMDEILAGFRLPRTENMEKRLDDLTQRILQGR